MGLLFLRMLAGILAGLMAWLVMEPFAPRATSTDWERWERVTILLLGALVGAAVGGLDGYLRGGKTHTIRGAVLGGVLGGLGIMVGYGLGGSIVFGMFGSGVLLGDIVPLRMVARTLLFIPMGVALGAAIGVSGLNTKKAIQGAVGGGIGATVAGLLFDPIGEVFGKTLLTMQGIGQGEVGGPSRAITFVLLGGMIALFIGLVERATRSAWIRLILGRNEGKEWSIDSAQTFIGRNETAGIPLFGDPNVAPVHATITKANGQYWLTDGGSPIGTYVNGQRISQCPLIHGSQIQIGGYQLVFLMRNQQAPQRLVDGALPASRPQPVPVAPGPVAMSPQGFQAMQQTQAYPAPVMQPTQAYASPVAAGYTLIALDGPLAGQRFPVATPIELGRESVSVPMSFDGNASRRHASVSPGFGGLDVVDLGSTNGTYVNGQRVQQAQAAPGTILKVGNTSFRVEAA